MGVEQLRGAVGAVLSQGGRVYAPFDHTLVDSDDNADSTVSLAAPTDGSRWVLAGFVVSFSADPSAGKTVTITGYSPITDTSGSVTMTLLKGGIAPVILPAPVHFAPNRAASLTLAASGTGGTVGKIWAIAWKEKPVGE